jgi:hypothetical protein
MTKEQEILVAAAAAILHHDARTALTQHSAFFLQNVVDGKFGEHTSQITAEFRPAAGTVSLCAGRLFSGDAFRVEVGWSSPGAQDIEIAMGFSELIQSVCELGQIIRELHSNIERALSATESKS